MNGDQEDPRKQERPLPPGFRPRMTPDYSAPADTTLPRGFRPRQPEQEFVGPMPGEPEPEPGLLSRAWDVAGGVVGGVRGAVDKLAEFGGVGTPPIMGGPEVPAGIDYGRGPEGEAVGPTTQPEGPPRPGYYIPSAMGPPLEVGPPGAPEQFAAASMRPGARSRDAAMDRFFAENPDWAEFANRKFGTIQWPTYDPTGRQVPVEHELTGGDVLGGASAAMRVGSEYALWRGIGPFAKAAGKAAGPVAEAAGGAVRRVAEPLARAGRYTPGVERAVETAAGAASGGVTGAAGLTGFGVAHQAIEQGADVAGGYATPQEAFESAVYALPFYIALGGGLGMVIGGVAAAANVPGQTATTVGDVVRTRPTGTVGPHGFRPDPWDVLGVRRGATRQEVSRAYRERAATLTDRTNKGEAGSEEALVVVNTARDAVLTEIAQAEAAATAGARPQGPAAEPPAAPAGPQLGPGQPPRTPATTDPRVTRRGTRAEPISTGEIPRAEEALVGGPEVGGEGFTMRPAPVERGPLDMTFPRPGQEVVGPPPGKAPPGYERAYEDPGEMPPELEDLRFEAIDDLGGELRQPTPTTPTGQGGMDLNYASRFFEVDTQLDPTGAQAKKLERARKQVEALRVRLEKGEYKDERDRASLEKQLARSEARVAELEGGQDPATKLNEAFGGDEPAGPIEPPAPDTERVTATLTYEDILTRPDVPYRAKRAAQALSGLPVEERLAVAKWLEDLALHRMRGSLGQADAGAWIEMMAQPPSEVARSVAQDIVDSDPLDGLADIQLVRNALEMEAATAPTEPAGPVVGVGQQAAKLDARAEVPPTVHGKTAKLTMPDNNEYAVDYGLYWLDELVKSHRASDFQPNADFPAQAQGRDYTEKAAQQHVVEQAGKYNPDLIFDPTTRPSDGPPIIAGDFVGAGHGRLLIVEKAMEQPTHRIEHERALLEGANTFGYGSDQAIAMIAEGHKTGRIPVLARRLLPGQVDELDPQALRQFNLLSDQKVQKGKAPLEAAEGWATRMFANPAILNAFQVPEGGTLSKWLDTAEGKNWTKGLVGPVISQAEQAEYMEADGTLNDVGKMAVKHAVQVAVLKDAGVVKRAPSRSLQKLEHSFPQMLQAENTAGWGIDPEVRRALLALESYYKSPHGSYAEFRTQEVGEVFGGFKPHEHDLAQFIEDRTRAEIKEAFSKYARLAAETRGRKAGSNLDAFADLGEAPPMTKQQAFKEAFGFEGPGRFDNVFEEPPPGPKEPPVEKPGPGGETTESLDPESVTMIGDVKFDAQGGAGSTGVNRNVNYAGIEVRMTPNEFLSVAAPRGTHSEASLNYLKKAISGTEGIAPPFLDVDTRSGKAIVDQHEGRTRMFLLAERGYGDVPVPVHIFGRGDMKARHWTDDQVALLRELAAEPRGGGTAVVDATAHGVIRDKQAIYPIELPGTKMEPRTQGGVKPSKEKRFQNHKYKVGTRVNTPGGEAVVRGTGAYDAEGNALYEINLDGKLVGYTEAELSSVGPPEEAKNLFWGYKYLNRKSHGYTVWDASGNIVEEGLKGIDGARKAGGAHMDALPQPWPYESPGRSWGTVTSPYQHFKQFADTPMWHGRFLVNFDYTSRGGQIKRDATGIELFDRATGEQFTADVASDVEALLVERAGVPDYLQGEVNEWGDIPCPDCKAPPGEPCRAASGPRPTPHKAREVSVKKAQKAKAKLDLFTDKGPGGRSTAEGGFVGRQPHPESNTARSRARALREAKELLGPDAPRDRIDWLAKLKLREITGSPVSPGGNHTYNVRAARLEDAMYAGPDLPKQRQNDIASWLLGEDGEVFGERARPNKSERGQLGVTSAPGQPGVFQVVRQRAGEVTAKAKHLAKVWLTTAGDLPPDVFARKIQKDGWFSSQQKLVEFTLREFRAAVRQVKGIKGTYALTDAELEAINDVYAGRAAPSTIPKPIADVVETMRAQTDAYSRRMIDNGMVEGDLEATFNDNMGLYLNRSYRVYDDPKWAQKVPQDVRNKAKALIRGEIEAFYTDKAGNLTITPDELEELTAGYIEHLLYRQEAESPLNYFAKGKLGSKNLSILKKRTDMSPEIRALMGEYTGIDVNYVRTSMKQARLIANHEFLTDVRDAGLGTIFFENPIVRNGVEYTARIAADGSKAMAPLNGYYTTPEILAAFESIEAVAQVSPFLRRYMVVNSGVKISKTVLSQMTHIRNFFANPLFLLANGHWPVQNLNKALSTLTANVGGVEVAFEKLGRDTQLWRDYYRELQEYGVVDESTKADELRDILRDASKRGWDPDTGLDPTRSVLRKGLDIASSLYRTEDDFHKVIFYEAELKDLRWAQEEPGFAETLEETKAKASAHTRNGMPTYSLVAPGIKMLRRAPVVGTFVSFPAEVWRTSYHLLDRIATDIRDPNPRVRKLGWKRLAGLLATAAIVPAATKASRLMHGIGVGDDDDIRHFLPPWSRNSSILYLGRAENGDVKYVDLSYTDPYNYIRKPIIAMLQGGDWDEALSRSIMETAQPFLGEEILYERIADIQRNLKKNGGQVYNPEAPKEEQMQDIMGHIWGALEPGTISSLQRIDKAYSGETTPHGRSYDFSEEILAMFLGVRFSRVDIRQALSFKARDSRRRWEDARRLLTSPMAQRGVLTREQVAKAYKEMDASRQAIWKDTRQYLEAANRLGVKPEELGPILVQADWSQAETAAILRGYYPAYRPSDQYWGDTYSAQTEARRGLVNRMADSTTIVHNRGVPRP